MQIDKGIPIPARNKWKSTAEGMVEGDSVLCPSQYEAAKLAFAIRKTGSGARQKKMDGGVRVWNTGVEDV